MIVMKNAEFPAIEELLPHRGTMALVDRVLDCTAQSVTVAARVDANAWYADEHGAMPAWIGIELMAQAIAAHVGLIARQSGGHARPGVLLGSRKYEALRPAFEPEAQLTIFADEVLRAAEGHGAYDCTIALADGTVVARAVIKVFQPTDFESFIEGSVSV
jgi:predicted hotdog family 3-hydroxylacyl-ACP dehydratase